jgi:hypothetical protein
MAAQVCRQPEDLYSARAREAIGRHLHSWLQRRCVTPFELLHRADLAEQLEACETELSVALSNAALAESAAQGAPLEPTRRTLESLAQRAMNRLFRKDHDARFQLGAALAERLGRHTTWRDKLEACLSLIEALAQQPAGAPALRALQQPLTDILGGIGDLDDLFGAAPLGDHLLILLQIASSPLVADLIEDDAALRRTLPRLRGLSARLVRTLHRDDAFVHVRRAIARRVLAALTSEATLWPNNPAHELDGLKALGALLKVSRPLLGSEEVTAALERRWRRLAAPAFIEARLSQCLSTWEEIDALLDMIDAVDDRPARDTLGRALLAWLEQPGLQAELRAGPDPVAVSLQRLNAAAARVMAGSLQPEVQSQALRRLRQLAAALRPAGEPERIFLVKH